MIARRARVGLGGALVWAACVLGACASDDGSSATTPTEDAGWIPLGGEDEGGADAISPDASTAEDAAAPDGAPAYPADRFITDVVSFTPGACAGFGAAKMPGVVQGPPEGAGDQMGSLDVVSFGVGGEMIVRFEEGIVDGPGPDFVVFENAFFAGGDPTKIAADFAQIGVSEDGVVWHDFPCAPGTAPPFGTCAGWRPVYASSSNGISPFDPARAGGDPYDLADLGLSEIRYVRIQDRATDGCPDGGKMTTAGFDLDAIAVIHPKVGPR